VTGATTSDIKAPAGALHLLFGFGGRAGRRQYWFGLAAALVPGVLALILAGQAMSTTGGDSIVLLGFPLFLLFAWMYMAVAIKRLQDLGLPAWKYLAYFAAPLIAIIVAVELIEQLWPLILLAAAAVLIVPGLLNSKTT
jgi:uncharacterized membrane protein YhaH (DUF805 family)